MNTVLRREESLPSIIVFGKVDSWVDPLAAAIMFNGGTLLKRILDLFFARRSRHGRTFGYHFMKPISGDCLSRVHPDLVYVHAPVYYYESSTRAESVPWVTNGWLRRRSSRGLAAAASSPTAIWIYCKRATIVGLSGASFHPCRRG